MRTRHLLRLIAFVAYLCFSSSAFAQDPMVANSVNTGIPPNAILSGSDIDTVQINNGNLHVEIPIYTSAGRGKDLSVAYRYIYDSSEWTTTETDRNGGYYFNIKLEDINNNKLGFALVSNQSYYFTMSHMTQNCNGQNTQITYNYVSREPNGTKHHFEPDPSFQTACNGMPNTRYSDDGSGDRLVISGNTYTIVDKDGGVKGVYDSNGNQVGVGNTDTLGRTLLTPPSYYDPSGNQQTPQVTTTPLTISTHLCGGLNNPINNDYCYEYTTNSWYGLHTLTIPDGTGQQRLTYTIQYVGYDNGEISSITLPTGAVISYAWVNVLNPVSLYTQQRVHTRTVSISGSQPAIWTYDYTMSPTRTTTVTDPYGNQTKYICGTLAPYWPDNQNWNVIDDPPCLMSEVDYYAGTVASGTLLKKVVTDYWSPTAVPKAVTTTMYSSISGDTSLVSRVETDYDSISTTAGYATWGNPIEKREFSNGTLIRRTHYSYLHQTNSAYLNANLVSLPTDVVVYDGGTPGTAGPYTMNYSRGNRVAETKYTYDDQPFVTLPGSPPGHDNTNFGTSNTVRGNLTTTTKWKNTTNTWTPLAVNTYDILGNLRTSTDPGGHTTNYSYTDNWNGQSGSCVPASTSYAFLTQVTNALNQSTSFSHYCTGETHTVTDPNGQVSTYLFDAISRVTEADFPDTGKLTFDYHGDTYPLQASRTILIDTGISKTETVHFDDLGRTISTTLDSDPAGVDTVDISYDKMGRKASVSNLHRSTTSSTDGTTYYDYDPLGRLCKTTPQDVGTHTADCTSGSGVAKNVYGAACTTSTDPAGNTRKTCADGMGRLVSAWEPNSTNTAFPYETDYQYDALDNLTCVEQHGSVTGTGCSVDPSNDASSPWRVRRFTYDSLSELTQANNPESGTVQYAYNSDSVLVSKTDARNITINYNPPDSPIDALHRVTKKTYSNSDPAVTYSYDAFVSGTNFGKGHRTGMTDASGSSNWTYDKMGRPWSETHTITGATGSKTISTTYHLDGSVNVITYPSGSGSTVGYTYNAGGVLTLVKDTTHNVTYFQTPSYYPSGQLNQATYGSGKLTSIYNSRLQPCWFYATPGTALATTTLCSGSASAANILDLKYNFGAGSNDNGNVVGITNNKDSNRSVTFTYDSFNRIASATTPNTDCSVLPSGITKNWGESFTIDAWGNLTGRTVTKCSAEPLSVTALANNRLSGYGYDADGNMISNGSASYTYNGESQLATTAGVTYTYDGDGNRVKKSNGTLYWGSGPLLENDLSGNLQREFIFVGGKRVARRDITAGAQYYYFTDHLGSSDVVTNSSGAIQNESDYYPYGGERVYSQTLANQNYKFTGGERDSESVLDNFGARYDGSSLGRFMTPDPSSNGIAPGDSQSWNLYSYVRNRPTRSIDIGGNWATDVHAEIVTVALQGLVSAGELKRLVAEQYVMDKNQAPEFQYRHAMSNGQSNPAQSSEDATNKMWGFVATMMAGATATLGPNGQFNSVSLAYLGDAIHTVEDSTSPMHTSPSGQPLPWYGVAHGGFRHWQGENSPSDSWAGFGQAVRLTMAAFMQANPEVARKNGLSEATFNTEADRRISQYVENFYRMSGNVMSTDDWKIGAAGLCALGIPAACGW
jgi:RHS repeat-associated protein